MEVDFMIGTLKKLKKKKYINNWPCVFISKSKKNIDKYL